LKNHEKEQGGTGGVPIKKKRERRGPGRWGGWVDFSNEIKEGKVFLLNPIKAKKGKTFNSTATGGSSRPTT